MQEMEVEDCRGQEEEKEEVGEEDEEEKEEVGEEDEEERRKKEEEEEEEEKEEVCTIRWSLAEASGSCHVASLCSREKLNKDTQYPSGRKSSYHSTRALFPLQLLVIIFVC